MPSLVHVPACSTSNAGEFQSCSLASVSSSGSFTVAGLFAGIGGIELGLHESGGRTELLCEWWEPAQAVLAERFPGVPLAGDVRQLDRLPDVDVVTAGFPCTDLSQAGRTKGISGEASGLVAEVFRLLKGRRAPVLVLENVRNMLVLDGGQAMRYLVDELESLGYRWAYRLVDSRFTGVPQRRQRVIFVAALDLDPRTVLFADDAGEPDDEWFDDTAYGFYWTEGLRGVGWAKDAVPTLKAGSTIGIPSPPAIWNPGADADRLIVTPQLGDAEEMQGFPRGWTEPAAAVSSRKGTRWKLVGNAVTVGVSRWVGERLVTPGVPVVEGVAMPGRSKWPTAAFGSKGDAWTVDVSLWPKQMPYRHLADLVDLDAAPVLSSRATAGFLDRAGRSTLRFADGFIADMVQHAALMSGERAVA
jgi:DNA (cytosine-5)-methyltransferase 1